MEAQALECENVRAAAQAAEERYAALYDNIPLMYFTLSSDGDVTAVNLHGAHELGYEPQDLVGRSVLEVFHPDDRDDVARQLRQVLATPGRVAGWEFRKIRRDGTIVWVRESVRTVRTRSGGTQILVACQDITDSKEAEFRLREQDDRLRSFTLRSALREERERRRIAAGLHDEIAGVLARAARELAALRESSAPADRERLIEQIKAWIDSVIESARSLTFELSSPVLHELGLEAAIRDLGERTARRNGIRFRFETDKQTPRLAEGAEIALFRAVRQLFSNIEQHARANNVTIAVARVDDQIVIRIEDDGQGFDPAERCADGRANRGFGLFSVRVGVEELGGRLEIHSVPGTGTRAVLAVPLTSGEQPQPMEDSTTEQ